MILLFPTLYFLLIIQLLFNIKKKKVRKTAQAALLVLLEQELVARHDVEDQVCPLLMMLTNAEAHDDFRTEAAAVSLSTFSYCLSRIASRVCNK